MTKGVHTAFALTCPLRRGDVQAESASQLTHLVLITAQGSRLNAHWWARVWKNNKHTWSPGQSHADLSDFPASDHYSGTISALAVHAHSRRLLLVKDRAILDGRLDFSLAGSQTAISYQDVQHLIQLPEAGCSCIVYDQHASRLAAALGSSIYILAQGVMHSSSGPSKFDSSDNSRQNAARFRLDGHLAPVIQIEFAHNAFWLVSLSLDKCFKIWDLKLKACIYQSPILFPTSRPLRLSLHSDRLVLASEHGLIQVYQLAPVVRQQQGSTSRKVSGAEPDVEPRLSFTLDVAKQEYTADRLEREENRAMSQTHIISSSAGRLFKADSGKDLQVDSKILDQSVETTREILSVHCIENWIAIATPSRLHLCDSKSQQLETLVYWKSINAASTIDLSGHSETMDKGLSPVGMIEHCTLFQHSSSVAHYMVCPFFSQQVFKVVDVDLPLRPDHELLGVTGGVRQQCDMIVDALGDAFAPELSVAVALQAAMSVVMRASESSWAKQTAIACAATFAKRSIMTLKDFSETSTEMKKALDQELPLGFGALLRELADMSQSPTHTDSAIEAGPEIDPSARLSFNAVPLEELRNNSPLKNHTWTIKSKTSSLDKPILMRKTIRSSGYSTAPHVPKHLQKHKPATSKKTTFAKMPAVDTNACEWMHLIEQEHDETTATACLSPVSTTVLHATPITYCKYSPEATFFSFGDSNGTTVIMKTDQLCSGRGAPPLPESTYSLAQSVQLIDWSCDEKLLSVATRRELGVWGVGADAEHSGPMFTIPRASMSCGKFFYRSKFLILASGKTLELIKFKGKDNVFKLPSINGTKSNSLTHLPTSGKKRVMPRNNSATGSIERARELSASADASDRTKTVWAWEADAQCISCMDAPDLRESPLAMIATSDRKVIALDVDAQRPSAIYKPQPSLADMETLDLSSGSSTLSSRAPYAIRVPDYSWVAAGGSSAAHLFVTSAVGDVAKLWDIRTMTAVARFGAGGSLAALRSRSLGSGAALSPCGTMVVACLEDPSAALVCFDVRQGLLVSKCKSPARSGGATATHVGGELYSTFDFDPHHAQLAACTTRGRCTMLGCTT